MAGRFRLDGRDTAEALHWIRGFEIGRRAQSPIWQYNCIGFELRHRTRSTDVTDHKFRVGERVELVPSLSERFAATGIYEVIRQLPTSNGELGYRIKSAREPYERVVRESQLRRS